MKYVSQRRIGWLSLQVSRYLMTSGQKYFSAINLLNNGAISKLPDDIIVKEAALRPPLSFAPLDLLEGDRYSIRITNS